MDKWLKHKKYVNEVIAPCVESEHEELDLPLKSKALCVFDVYIQGA